MDSEFSEIMKNHRAQYLPEGDVELVSFGSDKFQKYQELGLNSGEDFVTVEEGDKRFVAIVLDDKFELELSSSLDHYNTGILVSHGKKLKKNYQDLEDLSKSNAAFINSVNTAAKKVKEEDGVATESAMIHGSLFPSMETYRDSFSRAEVVFQPFENPGGDFYWAKSYQHMFMAIVGDCTGHGMQGAMIAMSVMTLLKRVFRLPPISIKQATDEFYEIFGEIMEEEKLDVFDVELGIVLLDKRNNKVQYYGSGVNCIYKNGVSSDLYTTRKTKVLRGTQDSYTIEGKPGDQVFLFSDGMSDQFDANNKRKLGSQQLYEMVSEIEAPVTKEAFMEKFESFRGDTPSLDDQTMLMLTI